MTTKRFNEIKENETKFNESMKSAVNHLDEIIGCFEMELDAIKDRYQAGEDYSFTDEERIDWLEDAIKEYKKLLEKLDEIEIDDVLYGYDC